MRKKPENVLRKLNGQVKKLEAQGGGTLELGDGVHAIDRPLRLPASVSLCMTPHAVIKAMPKFSGEAIVIKSAGEKGIHKSCGCIRGGVIDGGKQALTGLKIEYASRLEISELEVRDATYKGIHVVCWYEVNLSHVRCNVDLNTPYAPKSIGIHYERCGDSLIQGATIIGYETGLRSDTWANDIQQVHTWNYDPGQGPMKYSFYAGGIYDTYNQCYADSPAVAGFYVNRPFNRISACRIYYSRWAKDNSGSGIFVGENGGHGTYTGNVFLWDKGHALAQKYSGNLKTASILGDNSGTMNAVPQIPSFKDGKIGDYAWVTKGKEEALYVKTKKGWQRS